MPTPPSEAEIEILQVLWQHGQSTVREIHELLDTKRKVGYTTTLTQVQRMVKKNFVEQHRSGKSHTFTALLSEEDVQGTLVQRLVDTAFKGSTANLLMHALGKGNPNQGELEALEAWLEAKRNEETDS